MVQSKIPPYQPASLGRFDSQAEAMPVGFVVYIETASIGTTL